VALLALSDLDFIVTFFSLTRLGHVILLLSPRLAPVAVASLLETAGCENLLYGAGGNILSTVTQLARERPINSQPVLSRVDYDAQATADDVPFSRVFDRKAESEKICLISHSSGSAGLPELLFLRHRVLVSQPLQGSGRHAFNSLPWYHMHGMTTSFQAMWMRKTAYMYNAHLPLTRSHLVSVMETVRPEVFHAVPYVLELLGETQRGVDTMKNCEFVTYSGSHCSDELGDRLVESGVNLIAVFGL